MKTVQQQIVHKWQLMLINEWDHILHENCTWPFLLKLAQESVTNI